MGGVFSGFLPFNEQDNGSDAGNKKDNLIQQIRNIPHKNIFFKDRITQAKGQIDGLVPRSFAACRKQPVSSVGVGEASPGANKYCRAVHLRVLPIERLPVCCLPQPGKGYHMGSPNAIIHVS